MLANIHSIVLWLTVLAYFLLSLALLYHWYKYTINPGVFLFTSILYLGLTAPLILLMAVAVAAM